MSEIHLCPYCHGQRTVSKPPWVAGDQITWTGSSAQNYACPTCSGMGYVIVKNESLPIIPQPDLPENLKNR